MKKLKLVIIVLVFLLLNLASCWKDTYDGNTLPPETQEGKNTFGCLVNGKVWVATVPSNLYFQGRDGIVIIAKKYVSKVNQEISFGLIDTLRETQYDLNDKNHEAIYNDNIKNYIFRTDSLIYTGSLEITKFDTIEKILSGRFNFKAKLDLPTVDSVITISDGRFDFRF